MNNSINRSDRFNRLEYAGDDFPYYAGKPVTIGPAQWLLVLAAVGLGFAVLVAPVPLLTGPFGLFLRAVLFALIPLLALRLVAGPAWTAIFRKVAWRDIFWMFAFALINLVVSVVVGLLVMKTVGAAANPAVSGLTGQTTGGQLQFLLNTIPQLFGEEVLSILPFLAVLYFAHSRFGLSRKTSIVLAWLISAVVFGLFHLPSYDWNWLQCIVVIGCARLVLTLAYIKTKNIWVSTGAHIINDWAIFGVSIFGAGLAATA